MQYFIYYKYLGYEDTLKTEIVNLRFLDRFQNLYIKKIYIFSQMFCQLTLSLLILGSVKSIIFDAH